MTFFYENKSEMLVNVLKYNRKEVIMSQNVSYITFLKDVAICSLGAFGGPEAHFGVFTQHLVVKKKYLSEEEMLELVAITTMLPGPSSTQTIVAIGHKLGGPLLGLLTLLVWALPIVLFMTMLAVIFAYFDAQNFSLDFVRFVGPMAVGFVVVAAIRINRKVIKDPLTFFLGCLSAITSYFLRFPWIYPILLFIGGALSVLTFERKSVWNKITMRTPWHYLILFVVIAVANIGLSMVTHHPLIVLFEQFYRFGYLVIGGGQVVIPLMYHELVQLSQYVTSQEFLIGFGFIQGLPGPMFSFSAFVGGLAMREFGTWTQIMGGLVSAIGIFLPGILLIYFVIPIWEQIKHIDMIKVSLKGVVAVAGGFIITAAFILLQRVGFDAVNIAVVIMTSYLLWFNKVPAPLIVFAVLLLGIIV